MLCWSCGYGTKIALFGLGRPGIGVPRPCLHGISIVLPAICLFVSASSGCCCEARVLQSHRRVFDGTLSLSSLSPADGDFLAALSQPGILSSGTAFRAKESKEGPAASKEGAWRRDGVEFCSGDACRSRRGEVGWRKGTGPPVSESNMCRGYLVLCGSPASVACPPAALLPLWDFRCLPFVSSRALFYSSSCLSMFSSAVPLSGMSLSLSCHDSRCRACFFPELFLWERGV